MDRWTREEIAMATKTNPNATSIIHRDGHVVLRAGTYIEIDGWHTGGGILLTSDWDRAEWYVSAKSGGPIDVLACNLRVTGRRTPRRNGSPWIRGRIEWVREEGDAMITGALRSGCWIKLGW